jgi:glycosyltransferase 2 family protein
VNGTRRWSVFGLRAALTICILAVLLAWLHPQELLDAMKRTGILLWVFLVITHILIHMVVVAKWRILLRAAGTETQMVDALRAHGAGVFGNLYLPSIVGGDVIRAGLVTPGGKNLAAVITGGLADRITDCVSLIVLSSIGMLWVPAAKIGIDLSILAIAITGVLATVLGGAIALRFVGPQTLPNRIASMFSDWRRACETMLDQKTSMFIAIVMSVSIQGFFVLQNVLIARAIGIDIPLAAWFVVWPIAKLASLMPISLGGLGVREGVLAALLVPLSVPPTFAVAESLVWQTVMYALGLFGGIASLWIGHFKSRRHDALTTNVETHTA